MIKNEFARNILHTNIMASKASADVKISTFLKRNGGMRLWITKWIFNNIRLNIFSGSTGASSFSKIEFSELMFPDGPQNGRWVLRIHEGAIVDIVCKNFRQAILIPDLHRFNKLWALGTPLYEVDYDIFPVKDNVEQYALSNTEDDPSYLLKNKVRIHSTLRYTARMEDNGLYLMCYPYDERSDDSLYIRGGQTVFLSIYRKFYQRQFSDVF